MDIERVQDLCLRCFFAAFDSKLRCSMLSEVPYALSREGESSGDRLYSCGNQVVGGDGGRRECKGILYNIFVGFMTFVLFICFSLAYGSFWIYLEVKGF